MINLSNTISKYLFQAMVDIPETMDWVTILSQTKYPCSEIYQGITKPKLVKSFSLIYLNMTLHYIIIKKRKVLKWTDYHITLPKNFIFDKNFLHHSWIEVGYQQVHICNIPFIYFPIQHMLLHYQLPSLSLEIMDLHHDK